MSTSKATTGNWDRSRFYRIEGLELPSVTTVLDVIAKPALGPWYAKEERRFFETAMLEVLSRPGARDPEYVLTAVAEAVTGIKAADRERQRAATIGTAVHAGIEWHLRRALGDDPGPEPRLPDAAAWAIESWKDWAASENLEPLAIERTIYCLDCGYAGTLDLYARVKGVPSILDWKTGRAIYPSSSNYASARSPTVYSPVSWRGKLTRAGTGASCASARAPGKHGSSWLARCPP